MKRILLTALLAVSLSTCALLEKAQSGDIMGTIGEGAKLSGDIAMRQAKCDGIAKKPVSYEEETQIGSAVAIGLAQKSGGVFIEISPDLKEPGLPTAAKWGGKKPKPGSGEKTDLTVYLNQVGKYLAHASARPTIDWTFIVMDSPSPNAFSAPGGYVVLTTGLLAKIDNEAQLAFVLAHEIGHVVNRDAINQYRSSKEGTCRAIAAVSSLAGDGLKAMIEGDLKNASGGVVEKIADAAVDLILKGNEKSAELAADKTAFELMANAGYDVKEIEKLFAAMPDGSGWLTPHPSNADRVAALKTVRNDFTAEYAGFIDLGALKAPKNDKQLKLVKK